jgi:type I restriction enzyme M protein
VWFPNGVFNPYTGIKTNLLFFEKEGKTTDVWYYEHPYPAGAKSCNKTKPINISEFEPEREWWDNRTETEQAWRVPVADIIKNNYNRDIKNPNVEEIDLGNPEEILAQYESARVAANEIRAELLSEIRGALER